MRVDHEDMLERIVRAIDNAGPLLIRLGPLYTDIGPEQAAKVIRAVNAARTVIKAALKAAPIDRRK